MRSTGIQAEGLLYTRRVAPSRLFFSEETSDHLPVPLGPGGGVPARRSAREWTRSKDNEAARPKFSSLRQRARQLEAGPHRCRHGGSVAGRLGLYRDRGG